MKRQNIASGTPWESIVGYSRAVRIGNHVWVAGTTATDAHGKVVGKGDAAEQTRFILQKVAGALTEAGATMNDVVRTRMFVTDISRWEAIGRVHGEVFGAVWPASTMVQVSALVDPDHLVEIEAEAYVPD
jgi:enamine deaminase RidA (YjgF/YER057c/UK114 family)